MLRSSTPSIRSPAIACAFRSLAPVARAPVRLLHKSDKSSENDYSQSPAAQQGAYVPPPTAGFQGFRRSSSDKWGLNNEPQASQQTSGLPRFARDHGSPNPTREMLSQRFARSDNAQGPRGVERREHTRDPSFAGRERYSRDNRSYGGREHARGPARGASNYGGRDHHSRDARDSGGRDIARDPSRNAGNFGDRPPRNGGGFNGRGHASRDSGDFGARDRPRDFGERQYARDPSRFGGSGRGREAFERREFARDTGRFDASERREPFERREYGRDRRQDSGPLHFAADPRPPVTERQREVDSRYKKKVDARARDRNRNRQFDDEESAILEEDDAQGISAKEAKKAKKAAKKKQKELIPIFLPQFTSVENLATMLNVRVEKFTKQLKVMGFTETDHSHVLNAEMAGLIATEYGYEPVIDRGDTVDLKPRPLATDASVLPSRPPIVTIMGHVDHGKTTLLDWLRKSTIAASEHGGITQHIGAFSVPMPSGKNITFLDTPGHAAFLSMRERGANVTDIVILVVAADDSVKPQTIEAIRHAKSANVPIIVAINKIDKEDANLDKVKGDLARHGVEVEDYGGDTQVVPVSGKTGQGMEELEESIIALSEILDHRAEEDGQAEGWVLEATTKKRGRVATVLVTRGTLRPGDVVAAGQTWTRVRSLINEHGVEVPFAGPGAPVEVDGWRDQPEAGDMCIQAETEDRAKAAVEYRVEKAERVQQAVDMEAINESRRAQREKEEFEEKIREEAKAAGKDPAAAVLEAARLGRDAKQGIQEVPFLIKADVSGSVEAVVDSITPLGNEEVKTKVIRSSFGSVSESDVDHAAASGAYILSFNLPTEPSVYQYARLKKVTILSHNVIYRLVDDVKTQLSDRLPPKVTTKVTGEAEIAQVFNINLKGRQYKPVAGCRVKNGVIHRNSTVRVVRNREQVWEGFLDSLKNVKKDVTEMKKGTDCGLSFEDFGEFKVGDQVQCYETITEKRTL